VESSPGDGTSKDDFGSKALIAHYNLPFFGKETPLIDVAACHQGRGDELPFFGLGSIVQEDGLIVDRRSKEASDAYVDLRNLRQGLLNDLCGVQRGRIKCFGIASAHARIKVDVGCCGVVAATQQHGGFVPTFNGSVG
jgi:hypothetical protein